MKLSELIKKVGDIDIDLAALTKSGMTEKPKKIDMSICIESGIDCEFSDMTETSSSRRYFSKLLHIGNDSAYGRFFKSGQHQNFLRCRPRMNHIHASPAGWITCPIPEGFIINYWNTNNTVYTNMITYKEKHWKAITMFQITGIQGGWKL